MILASPQLVAWTKAVEKAGGRIKVQCLEIGLRPSRRISAVQASGAMAFSAFPENFYLAGFRAELRGAAKPRLHEITVLDTSTKIVWLFAYTKETGLLTFGASAMEDLPEFALGEGERGEWRGMTYDGLAICQAGIRLWRTLAAHIDTPRKGDAW